jgi:hypothetical protein
VRLRLGGRRSERSTRDGSVTHRLLQTQAPAEPAALPASSASLVGSACARAARLSSSRLARSSADSGHFSVARFERRERPRPDIERPKVVVHRDQDRTTGAPAARLGACPMPRPGRRPRKTGRHVRISGIAGGRQDPTSETGALAQLGRWVGQPQALGWRLGSQAGPRHSGPSGGLSVRNAPCGAIDHRGHLCDLPSGDFDRGHSDHGA